MKKLLSLLIGATVAIIVVAAVLVPIIDDTQSKTVSVNQNANARYSVNIGTDLAGDLVYTYVDDKPTLNGDVLHFDTYANRNIICSSDTFRLMQYEASLSAYKYVEQGRAVDVSQFKVNADLTYEYTTTAGTTVTVDSAIRYLFYADDAGTLGAFWEGGGEFDDFWLDHNETAFVTIFNVLRADGQPDVDCMGLWSADSTTIGESWTPIYTQIESGVELVDHPVDYKVRGLTVYEGDLANRYNFNGCDVSATIDGIEYSVTRNDPVVFAPLEYHYRTASDNSIVGLLGAIPVLVIVGIIAYVARTALKERV